LKDLIRQLWILASSQKSHRRSLHELWWASRSQPLTIIKWWSQPLLRIPSLPFATDDKGEKSAILNIADSQSFIQELGDLPACAERGNEGTISHEDFLGELKEDSLV
jgi:hypothetical protein